MARFSDACNFHFVRQELGPLWFWRRFIMAFETCNPKLYDKLRHVMPYTFPQPDGRPQPQLMLMAELIERKFSLSMAAEPESRTVLADHYITQYSSDYMEISDIWRTHYRSRNEDINEFFIREGVIKQDGEQMLCGSRGILVVGMYSFWPKLWKRIRG